MRRSEKLSTNIKRVVTQYPNKPPKIEYKIRKIDVSFEDLDDIKPRYWENLEKDDILLILSRKNYLRHYWEKSYESENRKFRWAYTKATQHGFVYHRVSDRQNTD